MEKYNKKIIIKARKTKEVIVMKRTEDDRFWYGAPPFFCATSDRCSGEKPVAVDGLTVGRRIAVLLSDCRATVEGDVLVAAAALEELLIIAPTGDSGEAEKLAAAVGAKLRTVAGPAEVAAALSSLLDT